MADSVSVGRYRHFKGGEYRVLGIARDSETEEPMVVYCPADTPEQLWVRSVAMWGELVEREGFLGPRFERLGD